MEGTNSHDRLIITEIMINAQCNKIPHWKAPGRDGVQGYWITKLDTMHDKMATQRHISW